jgi:hypothetical protein
MLAGRAFACKPVLPADSGMPFEIPAASRPPSLRNSLLSAAGAVHKKDISKNQCATQPWTARNAIASAQNVIAYILGEMWLVASV